MKTILISAMLQSRQAWLPELCEPIKINEFIKNNDYEQKFIAHCVDEEKKLLNDAVVDTSASKIILIGPEGDFTEDEIQRCVATKFYSCKFGRNKIKNRNRRHSSGRSFDASHTSQNIVFSIFLFTLKGAQTVRPSFQKSQNIYFRFSGTKIFLKSCVKIVGQHRAPGRPVMGHISPPDIQLIINSFAV